MQFDTLQQWTEIEFKLKYGYESEYNKSKEWHGNQLKINFICTENRVQKVFIVGTNVDILKVLDIGLVEDLHIVCAVQCWLK